MKLSTEQLAMSGRTGMRVTSNFIVFLVLTVMMSMLSSSAKAQQPKMPLVGLLLSGSRSTTTVHIEAFRQGLRELEYIEKQNIAIEYRYAEGKYERLPTFTAELIHLKVDVIFAQAAPAIRAAKEATKTVPIVFEMLADPVSAGFVASLSKPGGNLTGVGGLAPELSGKRLELLKQIIPRLSSVAILGNSTNPNFRAVLRETEMAATALGLRLRSVDVLEAGRLEEAFSTIINVRAEALSVIPDPMFGAELRKIVHFAAQNRLPTVYGISGAVETGALMAYAPSQREMFRRAATYVDRILKGANPAHLPVEQPTKFDLEINLRTARQIGITIPQAVLYRADKVMK